MRFAGRGSSLQIEEGLMRSSPVRLLVSAAVVAVFAVAPVAANAGASSVAKVGPLKLCTYSTGELNEGSQALMVKVVASGGAGVRGTLRMTGPGLNRTVPFKLKKGGIGQVALPLTSPVTVTLTTTLAVKGVKHARTDHVTYTPTNATTAAGQRGCVAR
jgi:hypothetical protein